MSLVLFLTFHHAAPDPLPTATVRALPGLAGVLAHTPAATSDPYLDDGRPPPLVLELAFAGIEPLEAALSGALRTIASPGEVGIQAMLARSYPVPEPRQAARACTYLVAYAGQAEDPNAWLGHYLAHHPGIMARFPAIRGIAVYTRIDWCSPPGWRREEALQRNKVVFDDPAALTAALNSPVRHEMRADFARFPPYRGPVTHFPMHTVAL